MAKFVLLKKQSTVLLGYVFQNFLKLFHQTFCRALGDQLDGHTGNHLKHRLDTVRYMINHRGHFEQFIDVPFDRYGWFCQSMWIFAFVCLIFRYWIFCI